MRDGGCGRRKICDCGRRRDNGRERSPLSRFAEGKWGRKLDRGQRAKLKILGFGVVVCQDPEHRNVNVDYTEAPTPVQLEQQLKKKIKLVLNKEDYMLQEYDEAISFMSSLREIKLKESVPKELKCPLSGEIMGEPMVVASGQTYDHPSIEEGFRQGHGTFPVTKQDLTNSPLTPNDLLKRITQWHTQRSIDPPNPIHDINEAATITFSGQGLLNSLLDNMSSSLLGLLDWLLHNMSSSLLDQKSSAKIL